MIMLLKTYCEKPPKTREKCLWSKKYMNENFLSKIHLQVMVQCIREIVFTTTRTMPVQKQKIKTNFTEFF